jgi:hypothetical protein
MAETLIGYYHPRGDASTFKIGIVIDTLYTEYGGYGIVQHALGNNDRSMGLAALLEPVTTAKIEGKHSRRDWFLLHRIKEGSVIIIQIADREVTKVDRKNFLFNQGGVLPFKTFNQGYEEENGDTPLNINTVTIVDFDAQRVTDWLGHALSKEQVNNTLIGYLKDFLYADNFDSGYEYRRWKQSKEIKHQQWLQQQAKDLAEKRRKELR